METLFGLGRCVMIPGAQALLEQAARTPADFLARHALGDWGELDPDDRELNDAELQRPEDERGRIMSSYQVGNKKVWVITDFCPEQPEYHVTTLLLPEEY
jgi:hypothetical protein